MTEWREDLDNLRKEVGNRVVEEAAVPAKESQKATPKLVRDCLYSNELGDGTLFAALMRGQLVFVKNSQEWLEWTGHCWQRDIMGRAYSSVEKVCKAYLDEYSRLSVEVSEQTAVGEMDPGAFKKIKGIQEAILKRVNQLRSANRRNAIINFSHTIENPLAISGDELDAKPMLLPCANGVIDLETGELNPGRPEDFLTLRSPVEWRGIDYPAPRWEKALLEIFNGNQDLVDYFGRVFGYGITGVVTEKIFPMLYGRTGWNGRSMLVETISHVMGQLAASISSDMLLAQKYGKSSSGPSPDIMALRGIRMAFASEIDEGQQFSASMIKKLTGNDELVGRNPHDKYQSHFSPTHKLIVMTNTQPAAPGHDKAFWERLKLIPFDISFVSRDPREPHERSANLNLGAELLEEAPGILAWLVRGCLLWQAWGLQAPKAVTEASRKYQRNEDMMGDFQEECLDTGPALRGKASDLYNVFVPWFHENIGKKEPSGTWFGKQMTARFEKEKINGCNYYIGIGLKGEVETLVE